jgi:SpoVK/Ycf46/Vps4 family AAA+-type ATPase
MDDPDGSLSMATLPVSIVPAASCLVNLPLELHLHEPPLILRVTPCPAKGSGASAPAASFVVGWGGGAARGRTLELPAALAEALGLHGVDEASVCVVDNLPLATALWVQPESTVDWEVANRDAEALRSQVLMQVFAASIGQRLPLWVHSTECVWVRVLRAEPAAPTLRLAAGMDLIIAPPGEETSSETAPSPPKARQRPRWLRLGASVDSGAGKGRESRAALSVGLNQQTMRLLGVSDGELLILRANGARPPNQRSQLHQQRTATPPAVAFGYATTLPLSDAPTGHAMLSLVLRRHLGGEVGTHIRVRAAAAGAGCSRIPETLTVHMLDGAGGGVAPSLQSPEATPKATVIAEALEEWLQRNASSVHDSSRRSGDDDDDVDDGIGRCAVFPQGAVVELAGIGLVQLIFHSTSPVPTQPLPREGMGLMGNGGASPAASATGDDSPFILSPGSTQARGGELSVVLGTRKPWIATTTSGVHAEARLLCDAWLASASPHPTQLGGRRKDLARLRERACGALQAMGAGGADGALMGLLITGPRGVGKSAVAEALAASPIFGGPAVPQQQHLGESIGYGVPVWSVSVAAETLLAAQQPAALLGRLHALLERASRCAPAILILEDLHQVFPAVPAAAPEAAAIVPLAEAAVELLAAFAHTSDRPPVLIVATSPAADKLHDGLRAAGLFDTEHKIATPDRTQRARTLAALARHMNAVLSPAPLDWAARATEGFVAVELRQLLEGARLAAASRSLLPGNSRSSPASADDMTALEICEVDLREALPHVTSEVRTSLGGGTSDAAGIGTPSDAAGASGKSWADVGGVEHVKRVLIESVILPRDYPELFEAAPLRLTSGALLYGHAGCGKTLLAATLAAEAHLPFVTVKGPELLNKYIGASEAAVRDLFERAASCRPCILFFDEFEAIAPRRGQDSTGVTDRVVNQLLCELDGVEALRGVFVLAASNRPELIDPALLRPGRLDRKLFCPLPDIEGRAAILQALMRRLRCSAPLLSMDFAQSLAARCDGFSGADLQALLYNAQLAAIHERLHTDAPDDAARSSSRNAETNGAPPLVAAAHVHRIRDALDPAKPWTHTPREWLEHLSPGSGMRAESSAGSASPRICIELSHVEEALLSTRPSIAPDLFHEREAAFKRFADGSTLGAQGSEGTTSRLWELLSGGGRSVHA